MRVKTNFDQKNIPVAEPDLDQKELEKAIDCVKSGWISSIGKYVTEFEEGFSRFCKTKYGVASSNGTTALHLALLALGVGPGDEVICPTLTFVASANTIVYTGAKPVFVDSESQTWNMDVDAVKAKISPKTKAILVVHLYGHPAHLEPILELANSKGLSVIEDAAEAHGALYQGQKVGSLGSIGCFSFYGNKIITTGEGGMAVTNDKQLADRMKLLRDHAMDSNRRYWHPEMGYNYRLTNLQAAIGVAQLGKIEGFLEKRRGNAKLYSQFLKEVNGLIFCPKASWADPAYWMVSILIEDSFGMGRDAVMQELKVRGIDTRPFFIPMHQLPFYHSDERYPIAEGLSQKGINLPSSTLLKLEDIEYICQAIQVIGSTLR